MLSGYWHSESYCTFCGEELEPRLEGRGLVWAKYMTCSKKKFPHWWNLYRDDKHSNYFVEYSRVIMNYDPFTGTKVKGE